MTKQYKKFGELTEEEQNKRFQFWRKNGYILYSANLITELRKNDSPLWCENHYYEIPETKPSVNWDHLHHDVVAISQDSRDYGRAHFVMPTLCICSSGYKVWDDSGVAPSSRIDHLVESFKPGTCAPEDSLVIRPGFEDE